MKRTTNAVVKSEPKPKKSKPKVGSKTIQLGFNDYLKDKRLKEEL